MASNTNQYMQDNIVLADKIQRQAIDINYNVYLAASAGTGKTKTLIDRMLVLLLDGVHFSNILGITYTNAAANEMLTRLGKKLKTWHSMNELSLQQDLFLLMRCTASSFLLKKARELYLSYLDNFTLLRVQTIHALCIDISNKHTRLNDLSPNDTALIDDYTKNKFLRAAFEQSIIDTKENVLLGKAIKGISNKYCHQTLLGLANKILSQKQRLHSFMQSSDNLENLVKEQFSFYGADYYGDARQMVQMFLCKENYALKRFIALNSNLSDYTIEIFIKWHCGIKTKRHAIFYDYISLFLTKNWEPRKRVIFKQEILNVFPELNTLLAEEQKRIVNFFRARHRQEQAEFMRNILIFLNHLFRVYEQQKLRADIVDFDDLIINCLGLLSSHNDLYALMHSLDHDIHHLLIDEAQDLSNIQWL